MDEAPSPPRKGRDEGTVISILILIGLVVVGFIYVPKLIFGDSGSTPPTEQDKAFFIETALYSYALDHGKVYPTGKSSTEVFQKMIDQGYAKPSIFYFEMPGKKKPTSKALKPENVCWDITVPIEEGDPKEVPLVFSTGYRITYLPTGKAVPLKASSITIPGIFVTYKGSSTYKSWSADVLFINDDGLPDHIVKNFIGPDFDSKGKTYQQLTPDGPLSP